MSSGVRGEPGAHRLASTNKLNAWLRRLLFWRYLPRLPWLPNALTAARVPMTLAFLALFAYLWQPGSNDIRLWGLGLFVFTGLTDFIDGDYARHHKCTSAFGEIADPIADKFLMISALVVLMWLEALPRWAWLAIVPIAVREVGVTALRFWLVSRRPRIVQPADRGGKAKMLLQFALVVLCLWPLPPVAPVAIGRIVVLLATAALTLYSGGRYVRAGLVAVRLLEG
ncbi:MAG TPA: CDP-alcohol phosphatidyltransferase family protein [Candidatus Saccharimonadia bacterium]|nr:CDP-alcohol phosphatidyltransferase family protein [Candidatus Saccharimonadia bacterium]